jgi:VanZ family protein
MAAGAQFPALRNRWWPVVGWALFVLVGSTVRVKSPGIEVPGIGLDKFAHIAIYFVLTFLLHRALRPNTRSIRRALGYSFLLAATYGVAMEGLQWAFFPERSFEIWDIVANISGSIAALLVSRKRME